MAEIRKGDDERYARRQGSIKPPLFRALTPAATFFYWALEGRREQKSRQLNSIAKNSRRARTFLDNSLVWLSNALIGRGGPPSWPSPPSSRPAATCSRPCQAGA